VHVGDGLGLLFINITMKNDEMADRGFEKPSITKLPLVDAILLKESPLLPLMKANEELKTQLSVLTNKLKESTTSQSIITRTNNTLSSDVDSLKHNISTLVNILQNIT
jgi:hypothetical protein